MMTKLTSLKKGLKVAAIAIACLSIHQQTFAQVQVAEMLKGGVADASLLVKAYTTPFFRGFGAGLNGGWYNTAKTHGLGRFDVTLAMNACIVPTADRTYDASTLGFTKLTLGNPLNKIGQTVSGSLTPNNNPEFVLTQASPVIGAPAIEVARFSAPTGAGLPFSGAPTVQLAVGLIKNTEVIVRYIPTVSAGDFDMGLKGFGIKHDIKQWIPVVNKLPFDMAAYFGYTKLDVNVGLGLTPDATVPDRQTENNGEYAEQAMKLNTTASTFGLILSKKVLMLTVYGGANYQSSKTTLSLKGDFPITSVETRSTDPNYGKKVITKVTDPVNFDVDGANGMSATLGARLKLLVLTFQGSYTFAEYPMATFGVGINIDLK
jgi:hypothetical protein